MTATSVSMRAGSALVFAFRMALKSYVDDIALRGLAQVGFEILGVADEAPVDEDLRHRRRAGDRANRTRAHLVTERNLDEVVAGFSEQALRLRAERAAFARQHRYAI